MFTFATECGGRTMARADLALSSDPLVKALWPVPGREELQAMAEGLVAIALRWPGMAGLTRRSERRWGLLSVSDQFEAWVIGWPPGGTIELHDHGDSAGAVVVAEGQLVETLVAEKADGSVTTTSRRMAAGTSWTMGRRHIHDVVNDSTEPALSVHVYAPRLTSMTHYRLDGNLLRAGATVHYRLGDIVP